MTAPKLFLSIPVLGESSIIKNFFYSLTKQSYRNFKVYVCVNQYETWWEVTEKKHYCLDNTRSLAYLNQLKMDNLVIIDRSSRGNGWPDKKGGVGWARKILMDRIAEENKNGIIVSMDADTYYPVNYLEKIARYFHENREIAGLSIPYYHMLKNKLTDRYILRYEIYMRYYAINMLKIRNPYNFTALGSAMVIPLWAYNKIGGMTPVKSGEDFYLLQKLVKNGDVGQWVETVAYPSSRFSDRVLFGTGPAIIKGAAGNWSSYPFYPSHLFKMVEETYRLFPILYKRDVPTPMTDFLEKQFRTEYIWKPLRENYKDINNFIKACRNKVDGLRIRQFLRTLHEKEAAGRDEYVLKSFMRDNYADKLSQEFTGILRELDFNDTDIEKLDKIRNFLYAEEMNLRKLSGN